MMTFRALIVAIITALLLYAGGPALAQDAPIVKLELVPSLAAYPQGVSHPLALRLIIAKGFHINSPQPGEGLLPTKISIQTPKGLSVGKLSFPPAETIKLEMFEKPVSTYDGTVIVNTTLKVAPATRPGVYDLKVKVAYQGCNDSLCTMPQEVSRAFKVTVSPTGKPGKAINQKVFAK